MATDLGESVVAQELLALRPPRRRARRRVFPITAWNAWDRVRRRAAGLRDLAVSPHWLRHAHGTHALQKGRRRDGPRHPRPRLDRHDFALPARTAGDAKRRLPGGSTRCSSAATGSVLGDLLATRVWLLSRGVSLAPGEI